MRSLGYRAGKTTMPGLPELVREVQIGGQLTPTLEDKLNSLVGSKEFFDPEERQALDELMAFLKQTAIAPYRSPSLSQSRASKRG